MHEPLAVERCVEAADLRKAAGVGTHHAALGTTLSEHRGTAGLLGETDDACGDLGKTGNFLIRCLWKGGLRLGIYAASTPHRRRETTTTG